MKLRVLRFPLCLLTLWAPGAGCHAQLTTPAGFATLHDQRRFEYRAVSADGVVVAVQSHVNDEHANLDFWTSAIDRTLREDPEYHPDGVADVRTAGGLTGRRLAYRTGDAQSGRRYWVVVFVGRRRVFVVEAGGAVDTFDSVRDRIERAIATLSTG